MISSIFGKTKPINFIIVLAFLFVLYWIVHFFLFDKSYSPEELLVQTLILGVLLSSIFVIDFIIKRNKVTTPNSFGILFYGLLAMVFPETLTDSNAIFCSLFLLLATRRLISMRSLKSIKPKIFDTTFFIMIASLFYEWAALYLILVFTAIYIYQPKNIRNWMVPLAGIFTFFMITYCVLILANKTEFLVDHYEYAFEINAVYFSNWGNSSKLISYILLTLLVSIFAFLKLGKAGLGQIVTMRLIGFSFIIGLIVKVLTSAEGAYPIMITFFPTAIFMTNYVEAIKKPNIKEIILITAIVVPFLVFATSMAMK